MGDRVLQQGLQMVEHAPDGGLVKQIGAVFRGYAQAVFLFGHGNGDVEGGRTAVNADLLQGKVAAAGGKAGTDRCVLQNIHHLKKRRVAHTAFRLQGFHQHFKGQMLVFVSF